MYPLRILLLWIGFASLSGCQFYNNQPKTSSNLTVTAPQQKKKTVKVQQPITKKPVEVTDVWERIRNQLSMPVPNNALVNKYRQRFINNPQHLEEVSRRAKPFLYLITEKVEQQQMPIELALLPIVESAFDPYAENLSGAISGLWQFSSPMARHFGLSINWWYDGRRDIPAATDAALKMLDYLYDKTGDNWLYAIAAYNTGESRVINAVKNNRKEGKPTDFWSLSLPKETEQYVPQLLALADVIKNADKYGIDLEPIKNSPQVDIINTGSQIDLAIAAKMANMSISGIQKLNPGFNRWATPPQGPYNLVIPKTKTQQFKTALANTDKSEWIHWVRYKVKSGDALSKIAKKHKTNISILRDVNNLKSDNIVIGKYLLIPTANQDASAYSLSLSQRNLKKRSRNKKKVIYTVSSGDSLWTVARTHGVSVDQLADWNNISSKTSLKLNQKLTIWQSNTIKTIKYKVKNGDSLSRIAYKFNISIDDVVKWNHLKKNKYLQIGQLLTLKIKS